MFTKTSRTRLWYLDICGSFTCKSSIFLLSLCFNNSSASVSSNIPNIVTCKIGLEASLSPADYPIIRIVAGNSQGAEYKHTLHQVKIYYGFNLSEFDGLDIIYEKLYALEKEIRDALEPGLEPYFCKWVNTISDEDRIPEYKILCSSFEVKSF